MSSVYRVLCVSHDPAIPAEDEYTSPDAAENAIRRGVDGHQNCDLLIGRYSYPLVEVGCPPHTGPGRTGQHRCIPHSHTMWVGVEWLRILAVIHHSSTQRLQALAEESSLSHWSPERLRRLRPELSIDLEAS